MTNLTVFEFESNSVRVIELDGQHWFVAKDVAAVLDYADPSMMLKLVDDDDRCTINPQKLDSVKTTESFGSNTFKISLINQSGLYASIFGSTKPQAKAFKKWVTSVVLPSISKTGKYEINPVPAPEQQPLQLPPADVRASNYAQALEKMSALGILDIHNPRITQHIKDVAANIFISSNQLPASNEVWLGVAEKAEQLGYAANVVFKCRSALGKFVKKQAEVNPNIKSTTESRLVNGTMREVNLYLDNSQLTQAINDYFS